MASALGKPAAVRVLEGNPSNRPIPAGFPLPAGAAMAPDWIGDYGRLVWNRVTEAMPPGVYTSTDIETLAAYCKAANDLRTASNWIAVTGHVIYDARGPMVNPWTRIAREASNAVGTLGSKLGLDPTSRERLKAPEPPAPVSKFEGLTSIAGGKS